MVVPIRSQKACLTAIAIPEKAFGVPAFDGEVPSSLKIDMAIDLGSFSAEWAVEKEILNRTYEGAAPESSAFVGRKIEGRFSITPSPPIIKLVQNWGVALFEPQLATWSPNQGPVAQAPSTDGNIGSWTLDYLEYPTLDQAFRYYGVIFTEMVLEASRENPAYTIGLQFVARTRSKDFFTSPHRTDFDWTQPSGSPFLFKNASIEIGDQDLEVEGFRVTVRNPVKFNSFDEDGLVSAYGMDSQEVDVEVVFPHAEATADIVDAWFTSPAFEADFRAMFVHPASIRHPRGGPALAAVNAGAGFIPMSPEDVAEPGVDPKTEYRKLRGQDIVAFVGTQIDSPLNTRHIECHKIEDSKITSPAGFWFKSEPSEGVLRDAGLRKGFAAGYYVYSIAHEVVVQRCVPMAIERFDEGGIAKRRVRFVGLSGGATLGSQLIDSFNPALNTEIRP